MSSHFIIRFQTPKWKFDASQVSEVDEVSLNGNMILRTRAFSLHPLVDQLCKFMPIGPCIYTRRYKQKEK